MTLAEFAPIANVELINGYSLPELSEALDRTYQTKFANNFNNEDLVVKASFVTYLYSDYRQQIRIYVNCANCDNYQIDSFTISTNYLDDLANRYRLPSDPTFTINDIAESIMNYGSTYTISSHFCYGANEIGAMTTLNTLLSETIEQVNEDNDNIQLTVNELVLSHYSHNNVIFVKCADCDETLVYVDYANIRRYLNTANLPNNLTYSYLLDEAISHECNPCIEDPCEDFQNCSYCAEVYSGDYCASCYQLYDYCDCNFCPECNEPMYDSSYCEYCNDDDNETSGRLELRRYGSKPYYPERFHPELTPDNQTLRYFGVELEVDCHSASKFVTYRQDNNLIDPIFKADCSLDDSTGLEIVSYPATLDYWTNTYRPIYEGLIANCDIEANRSDYGLHIHVSRRSISPNSLSRLCKVWEGIDNDSYREIFGRNKSYKYANADSISEWSHKSAINFQNDDTIEFRSFATTTDVELVINRIQWLNDLIDYADMIEDIDAITEYMIEHAKKLQIA